jgi:hypothetical protein
MVFSEPRKWSNEMNAQNTNPTNIPDEVDLNVAIVGYINEHPSATPQEILKRCQFYRRHTTMEEVSAVTENMDWPGKDRPKPK